MTEGDGFSKALALLKDPRFAYIRKRADKYPLTLEEFDALPLPEGLSSTQTWELLTALRRLTAVEIPEFFVDACGRRGWYSITRSMLDDLAYIEKRCHSGSWLDEAVHSKAVTRFIVESHVNEALSAILEDGIVLDHRRANMVLFGERNPTCPEEQVLLNCHQTMWELDALVDQPCSPQLILSLHEKVSKDAPQRVTPPVALDLGSLLHAAERTSFLESVSHMINGDGIDKSDNPIAVALGIIHLFTNRQPLPSWNGVMAALMSRLLFLKAQLPVVALVPIMKVYRAWQQEAIRPPIVPVAFKDALVVAGDEIDYTLYDATMIRLVRLELDATESALRRVLRRDESLAQALIADAEMNHRQRSVLATALNDPGAVFRIDTHKRIHRVAYATARADLLGLADNGYLAHTRKGRAFVFTPTSELRRMLRQKNVTGGRGLRGATGNVAGERS